MGRSFVLVAAAVAVGLMPDRSMAFSMKRPTLTSNAPVTIDLVEGQTSFSKGQMEKPLPQPVTTNDMQSFSHRLDGEFRSSNSNASATTKPKNTKKEEETEVEKDTPFDLDMKFLDNPNDMDVFIRNEYTKWLQYHNKQADESRYPSFKENFLTQLKFDIENAKKDDKKPQFFHLNEYGDMTPTEYQQEIAMVKAYDNWCLAHGRKQDPVKYAVFKNNLQLVQESRETVADETDTQNTLNDNDNAWMALTEYADLTGEQFDWLTTDELFLKHRYAKWLKDYGKERGNFGEWKKTYAQQLAAIHRTEHQHVVKSFIFDEFSDLPEEEYRVEREYKDAYKTWCLQFDKPEDPARYEIFKMNFKHHIVRAIAKIDLNATDISDLPTLNQFADLSLGEFATIVSNEAFIQKEFKAWSDHYHRINGSYETFKANYLLQLQQIANGHCVRSFVFDEYSDLTQAQYDQELICQWDYQQWCDAYQKKASRERFQIFRVNHAVASSHNSTKSMTKDADLTQEEYMAMAKNETFIQNEYKEWLKFYCKKSGNYQTFHANFLQQIETLKGSYHSFKSFLFDEHSDLTQREREEETRLQEVYREWAKKHSKATTTSKFQAFKANYARSVSLAMELNEEADLTSEEFVKTVSGESFIKKEYNKWLEFYGKQKGNLETFRANYMEQLETIRELHCFKSFVLDEYSDLTELERAWEPFYVKAYDSWCDAYGMAQNKSRYEVFKKNCANQIHWNVTNGTALELTQYADVTKEEFVEITTTKDFIRGAFEKWMKSHNKKDGDYKTFADMYTLGIHSMDHTCGTLNLDENTDKKNVHQAVDVICRKEYHSWCKSRVKLEDEKRYTVFKINFLRRLPHCVGKEVDVHEFADRHTEESMELEQLYSAVYAKWTEAFGRNKNGKEYYIFKSNFLDQLAYEESSNATFAINEYGAMGKAEYFQMKRAPEYVRREFVKWTEQYNKTPEESNFKAFQKNYILQMEAEQERNDGVPFYLTKSKVRQYELDSFFHEKYDTWAAKFRREQNEARFEIFKVNYIDLLRFNNANGKFCSLNEFADSTQEQWERHPIRRRPAFVLDSKADKAMSTAASLSEDMLARLDRRKSVQRTPFFALDPVHEFEVFTFLSKQEEESTPEPTETD